ncbi:hypothetical protein CDFC105_43950 [Clostridioides difficile]|nr:hypothetical protein CDFC105_43950 [Clostridioides difficile]
MPSLVGSEMCIRDRSSIDIVNAIKNPETIPGFICGKITFLRAYIGVCLLYTSDAADDSLRVDLGGRRVL